MGVACLAGVAAAPAGLVTMGVACRAGVAAAPAGRVIMGVTCLSGASAGARTLPRVLPEALYLGGASTATVGCVSPTPGIPRYAVHHATVNGARAVPGGGPLYGFRSVLDMGHGME